MQPTSSEPRVVLEVEYWAQEKVVGLYGTDYSHGKLWIDPALAGPDQSPGDPMIGRYAWTPDCDEDCPPPEQRPRGPSFVTNDRVKLFPGEHFSDDHVHVVDNDGTRYPDFFLIDDTEYWSDTGRNFLLHLQFSSPVDFIHGEGLMQTFDVDLKSNNTAGYGFISGRLGPLGTELWQIVHFGLERIRVTPKVCRF